ncbi:MAG: hypothetical protein ACRD44_02345 [Bryobacteraceae bacterium]
MSRRVKVLFVCFANAIRSQMAEAMARAYGADVIDPRSAGLAATWAVSPIARQVMAERNLNMDEHFPKGLHELDANAFDLVVNLSGFPMPGGITAPVREWQVRDPVGEKEKPYRQAADEIERLVIALVLEFRNETMRKSAS